MARKTCAEEQIIGMLREVEVRLAQGEKAGAICRLVAFRSRSITEGVEHIVG